MNDERKIDQAKKDLDPANYGEDVAKKVAKEVVRKISEHDDMPFYTEENEKLLKEIVEETVKEIM